MATVLLTADAFGVADTFTIVVTAYDAATTYSVLINGKTVSVVGSGGSTATVATALQVALAASTYAEFLEFTWTVNASTITATANETTKVGKTHTITTAEAGGAGTVGDPTNTVTAKGPEGLTAENVKTTAGARTLPVNADTFVLQSLAGNLKYNLSALTAVTTLTLNAMASFEGNLGLPFTQEDGALDYNDYRVRYFTVTGGTFNIGYGEGDGSGMVMIDALTGQATVTVYKTDTSAEDDQHAFVFKGTHASNTLTALSGTIDVAPHAGELATLLTLTATGDAEVRTSSGVTLGTVNVEQAAQVTLNAAATITLIKVRGSATALVLATQTITTATLDGSSPTLEMQPAGAVTITTLNMYDRSTFDLDSSPASVTVTTLNVYGACTINDRSGRLKITNAVARPDLITFNGTPGRSLTYADP